MENNAEQPAYPASASWSDENPNVIQVQNAGLTKRELLAAMCLQGLCSNPHPDVIGMASLEKAAVLFADELLKQLK